MGQGFGILPSLGFLPMAPILWILLVAVTIVFLNICNHNTEGHSEKEKKAKYETIMADFQMAQ